MKRISIIGSGVVGQGVGKGFLENNQVIFFDINKNIVEKLKSQGFEATDNLEYAINNTDVSFIAVPTPSTEDGIDLSFIKSATENIAKILKNKKNYHIIVIKSTVVPKTTEEIVKPILERVSGKKCGEYFGLCVNPEFLTEISHKWDKTKEFERTLETEERIVIGTLDKRSGDILESIYKSFNKPIYRVDTKTAEMIKYASNCCLASRVSYWVEIFFLCKKLGIDGRLVADIVAKDKRIGKYGSVITDPPGFYGKCLPKDLEALIHMADSIGFGTILLKAVKEVNDNVQNRLIENEV